MHDLGFNLYNGPKSNVNTPFESQQATSYVLAVVIFAQSVTVCEISMFNVPKLSRLESLNQLIAVMLINAGLANSSDADGLGPYGWGDDHPH